MIRRPFVLFNVVLICLFPALAAAFQPASRPTRPLPILKVDQSVVELGAVWCGSRAKGAFPIQNLGNEPLQIIGLQSKSGCTLDPATPRQFAPASKAQLVAHLIVPPKAGPFEQLATLETNDPVTPKTTLTFRGIAKAAIEVDPPTAGFGKIPEGMPREKIVTLTNHLDEPVKIELEKIESEAFEFELVETKQGEEYQLKVRLKPPFDAGMRRAAVNLTTDLAIQPNIPIPAFVQLSPRIEMIPNQISLGAPNQTAETTRVVTLVNNGETPFRVIEAKATDPAIAVNVTDINPGKAYRVVVTMLRGYDPGPQPQIITLHTDDRQKPTLEIGIIGPAVPTSPQATSGIPTPIDKLLRKPAPAFELTTIDGKSVVNSAALANVLALNFFTSHNYDNTEVIKKVEQLRQQFAPRGVRFINVAEQTPTSPFTQEQMVESLKTLGVQAELALDLGNIVAEKFHLILYPTFVVIGKTGDIEIVQAGNPSDFLPSVKARLEVLLGPASLSTPTPTSGPTPEEILRRPALGMIGLSIPAFSLKTLDGKPVGDAEVQNAPATVLNFVAANCGFCRRQLPLVESVRTEYEKKGVRFVNIGQTMRKKFTADELTNALKAAGSNLELAYHPENSVGKLFKVSGYPCLFVIRRDGRIENVTVGAKKNLDAVLRTQLDAILKSDTAAKSGV